MHSKQKTDYRGIVAMEKYPVIYLNMPKAACTTIKNLMFYLEYGHFFDDPLAIHKAINSWKYLVNFRSPENLNHLIRQRKFSFSFVRDPIAKAYSCFIEKIYYVTPYSFHKIRAWLVKNYSLRLPEENKTDQLYDNAMHRDNFKKFLSFVEDNIAGKTPIRKDPHWSPQKHILDRHAENISLDFIGKIEHYTKGMSYVLDVIGVEDRLILDKRFNEGPPPPYKLSEIADAEVKSIAQRVYEKDYVAFGLFQ